MRVFYLGFVIQPAATTITAMTEVDSAGLSLEVVERSCTVWRIKRTHKCARAHTEKQRDRHTHRHTVHSYLRSCSIQKSQGPQHVPRDPRGCSLEAALVVDCVAFRGARACPWDCSLLTATSFCRRRAASLWFFIPGVPHLPHIPTLC